MKPIYTPLIFLTIVFLFSACQKDKSKTETKPNIIFLLTDDQRWDALGYAGNDIIKTPNMDNLASNGVHFSNAYVTTSICMASRATIFSGQYARNHQIWRFDQNFSDSAFNYTYPGILRKNGYYTGFIGKYGLGSEWGSAEATKNLPQDRFDYWNGFAGQGKYWEKENGTYKHLTQKIGQNTLEFLDSVGQEKPFCLSVSFKAPHVQDSHPRQFLYDSAYSDLYKDVIIPQPITGDSCFWDTYPEFFKKGNEARKRWGIRFSTPEKYQASVKGYYRLISGVDKVIGDLIRKLEEQGIAENTIIMLMGDNGFFLGEHGMAGKWYGHEESIRVPLIIYDPRRSKGERGLIKEEMVLNLDIAPTILSFAGVEAPPSMQGKSLLPLMDGTQKDWRDQFFYEHLFDNPNYNIPSIEGIVGGHYKLLQYVKQEPAYEQLFDRIQDPHEIQNKALDPAYQDTLESYRKKLKALKSKITQ